VLVLPATHTVPSTDTAGFDRVLAVVAGTTTSWSAVVPHWFLGDIRTSLSVEMSNALERTLLSSWFVVDVVRFNGRH
jgi:hypothetical protein